MTYSDDESEGSEGSNSHDGAFEHEETAHVDLKAFIADNPLIPSVRECNFTDFKNRWGNDTRFHIIEAFVASDDFHEEIAVEKTARKSKKSRDVRGATTSVATETWIQRVRIHSPILLHFLQERSPFAEWDTDLGKPLVFTRPFGCFIRTYSKMKEILLELEESVANAVPLPTSNATVEGNETWTSTDRGNLGSFQAKKARSDNGQPDIDHDTAALQHVRCYIKFLEEKIMPMNSMFLGTDKVMIRFDDLWYLFTHGEIIYTTSTPSKQPRDIDDIDRGGDDESFQTTFILQHRNYSWPDDLPPVERRMYLFATCIDHNGKTFGPRQTVITIGGWSGKKDIRQLPAYPLRFRENVEEFKAMLQERAEKLKACLKQRHVAYDGWTVSDPLLEVDYREEAPLYIDGDIVIDFGETLRNQPRWIPRFDFATAPMGSSWVIEVDKMPIWHWPNPVADKDWGKPYESIRERMIKVDDTELELERVLVRTTHPFFTAHNSGSAIKTLDGVDPVYALILPRRMLAYSLRQRQFVAVDVRSMEIKADYPDIFASLSIDEKHRQIVQCLVAEHFEKREMERRQPYSRSMSQDIVHGKGSGLSILLHGVPGVGKTATAEAVAQANNKPLFAITCGDLGITPQLVEQNLNEIFRLAHLWDCVLLFDEADVFLTRRNTQNLERSALVSGERS